MDKPKGNFNPIVPLNFFNAGSQISIPEFTRPGHDCAVLRVEEKFIHNVYCSDTSDLVICELKGIASSKDDYSPNMPSKINTLLQKIL